MRWLYRTLIRPVLFTRDAEEIHEFTMRWLARVARHRFVCEALAKLFQPPELPLEAFGLRFPNPVGLAAGMDKAATAVPAWAALGFGFSELGAVTWQAQPGNPRPRIFRVIEEEAIINRMGFNNVGARAFAECLADWHRKGRWPRQPVGINLGKSKITPLEQAHEDYAATFRVLWPHADFFVVNVSSPNTPNLRQLQDKAALDEILAALQETNQELARVKDSERTKPPVTSVPRGLRASLKPILVKVAPDLSFSALDEILELVEPRKVAGIVATNTTLTRPATADPNRQRLYAEAGGLSGRPLRARSTEVVRHLYRQTQGALPIIGVGGIFNAADAWEKIIAGASLVQVYTGLVFAGPGLPGEIVRGLQSRLAVEGMTELRQAVGMAVRA